MHSLVDCEMGVCCLWLLYTGGGFVWQGMVAVIGSFETATKQQQNYNKEGKVKKNKQTKNGAWEK